MWLNLEVAFLLYLWGLGISDIIYRSISKCWVVCGWILLGIYFYWNHPQGYEIVGGILLGTVFLLISKYTNEALGYGDSIIICLIAMWIGPQIAIYLLCASFALSAAYGLLKGSFERDTLKKDALKKEIPYLPFLAITCSVYLFIG